MEEDKGKVKKKELDELVEYLDKSEDPKAKAIKEFLLEHYIGIFEDKDNL